ncbi:MAG: thiosulfate oxidation carrier complex protein SoxZ [Pseudomonadota bacterium]
MTSNLRTRIAAPDHATAGEVIRIRTLIGHPMESGFRRDATGQAIARDILVRFECRFESALVFAADLAPGTAANPYLSFHFRAERSGTLAFVWRDQNGAETRDQHALVVE